MDISNIDCTKHLVWTMVNLSLLQTVIIRGLAPSSYAIEHFVSQWPFLLSTHTSLELESNVYTCRWELRLHVYAYTVRAGFHLAV